MDKLLSQDKVSVIIPVYNSQKYLSRCIHSIINQTYTNLEIIIIDDGSSDGSSDLIRILSEEDSRIIVKKIKNSGVSHARNVGLECSTGEYVCFIDSDDWIDKHMIEHMYLLQRKKAADIVQCSFGIIYEKNSTKKIYKEKECIGKNQVLLELANGNLANSVCNKIFCRKIINNNFFNEDLAIGEDFDFMYRCCLNAKKIYIDSHIYYFYFQRENSVMHKSIDEKIFQPIKILDMQMEDNKKNPKVYKAFRVRKVYLCMDIILKILNSGKYSNQLDSLINFVRKNGGCILFRNDCNVNMKMMMCILLFSPSCFIKLFKRINSSKKI